jgi:hypothetical protein
MSDSVDSKLCQGLANAMANAMVRQLAVGNHAFIIHILVQAIEVETDDRVSSSVLGKLWLHSNEAN